MAQNGKHKVKGYKGERPGSKRERARRVMDQAQQRGLSRAATITLAVKRTGIARPTSTNWYSRWHGERRAA